MEPTKIFASPCQRAGALEAEGRGRHGHELLLVVADLGRNQLDRARLLLFFLFFVLKMIIMVIISSLGGPVPRTSGGRDDVEELVEDDLGGLDELHVVPADGEDVVPDLDGEGALLLGGGGGGRLGGGAHLGEQLIHDPLVGLRGGSVVVVRLKLASAGVVVVGAVEYNVSAAAPLETRPERVELLGLGVERGRGRDDRGRARLLLRQRLVQLIPTTIEDRKRILERTDILGSNSTKYWPHLQYWVVCGLGLQPRLLSSSRWSMWTRATSGQRSSLQPDSRAVFRPSISSCME